MIPKDDGSYETLRTLRVLEELLGIVSDLREHQKAVPIIQMMLDEVQLSVNKVPSLCWLKLNIESSDSLLVSLRDFARLLEI